MFFRYNELCLANEDAPFSFQTIPKSSLQSKDEYFLYNEVNPIGSPAIRCSSSLFVLKKKTPDRK